MADLELDGPNSAISVDTLKPKTGTTLTLGESGDTITLGSGATQSGFGASGAVSWNTTPKTTNFTAVTGEGYFVDTSSGAITATLPSSPSAGDIVAFKDYAETFDTNFLTIARNGENIQGLANNSEITTSRASVVLVYVDSTKGWLYTMESNVQNLAPLFVTATGGTITTYGDYKVHTFTSSGTFTITNAGNPAGSTTIDALIVAGGGGGGAGRGGGGGAGGMLFRTGQPVSVQGYPITIGAGGAGSTGNSTPTQATNGSNSVAFSVTGTGGGRGGSGVVGTTPISIGASGGSGGGTTHGADGPNPSTQASFSGWTSKGNAGGNGNPVDNESAGGGGGAGDAGQAGDSSGNGGDGGKGFVNNYQTGSDQYYAGGGGGGFGADSLATSGDGGLGGGGNGAAGFSATATGPAEAGRANTGGGGGGGCYIPPGFTGANAGAAGGSGIVVIRYKFQ